jgi:hypothetical protein
VLSDAGLVRHEAVGTRRLYEVDRDGLSTLRDYLDGFWQGALERFREAADREGGTP